MPRYRIPRRGEVWRINLDPALGHEIQKTRPAVVVTNDIYNKHNWVVLVVPISTRDRAEYDQVLIHPPEGGLAGSSVTLPDQLRAVDRIRLVKRLGRLKPVTLLQIDQSLKAVLDLL